MKLSEYREKPVAANSNRSPDRKSGIPQKQVWYQRLNMVYCKYQRLRNVTGGKN